MNKYDKFVSHIFVFTAAKLEVTLCDVWGKVCRKYCKVNHRVPVGATFQFSPSCALSDPPSLFLPLLKTNFSRPNAVSPILMFKYSNWTVLVHFLWKPFVQQWRLRQHMLFFSAFAQTAFSQTRPRTGSIYKWTPQAHQNRHILTIYAPNPGVKHCSGYWRAIICRHSNVDFNLAEDGVGCEPNTLCAGLDTSEQRQHFIWPEDVTPPPPPPPAAGGLSGGYQPRC